MDPEVIVEAAARTVAAEIRRENGDERLAKAFEDFAELIYKLS